MRAGPSAHHYDVLVRLDLILVASSGVRGRTAHRGGVGARALVEAPHAIWLLEARIHLPTTMAGLQSCHGVASFPERGGSAFRDQNGRSPAHAYARARHVRDLDEDLEKVPQWFLEAAPVARRIRPPHADLASPESNFARRDVLGAAGRRSLPPPLHEVRSDARYAVKDGSGSTNPTPTGPGGVLCGASFPSLLLDDDASRVEHVRAIRRHKDLGVVLGV
mmetsp:Transcript_121625/g.344066  ORF Transcript_121625/g.344066 Transcript_121625/m.344066 type:complete len:220 (-) Transcript_121625:745-1404(-)